MSRFQIVENGSFVKEGTLDHIWDRFHVVIVGCHVLEGKGAIGVFLELDCERRSPAWTVVVAGNVCFTLIVDDRDGCSFFRLLQQLTRYPTILLVQDVYISLVAIFVLLCRHGEGMLR